MNFYSSNNPFNLKNGLFWVKKIVLAKGQNETSVLLEQNPFFIYLPILDVKSSLNFVK